MKKITLFIALVLSLSIFANENDYANTLGTLGHDDSCYLSPFLDTSKNKP